MMIISMAWTSEAFLSGKKTVTRRFWKDSYASKFHCGDLVYIWDRSPRLGGKEIGIIRITKQPYKERLADMPDDHFEREGGTLYWSDKDEFIKVMGGPYKIPWVIEFEKVGEAKT